MDKHLDTFSLQNRQWTYGIKTALYSCSRHITHKSGNSRSLLVPSNTCSALSSWPAHKISNIINLYPSIHCMKSHNVDTQSTFTVLFGSLSSCSKNPAQTNILLLHLSWQRWQQKCINRAEQRMKRRRRTNLLCSSRRCFLSRMYRTACLEIR